MRVWNKSIELGCRRSEWLTAVDVFMWRPSASWWWGMKYIIKRVFVKLFWVYSQVVNVALSPNSYHFIWCDMGEEIKGAFLLWKFGTMSHRIWMFLPRLTDHADLCFLKRNMYVRFESWLICLLFVVAQTDHFVYLHECPRISLRVYLWCRFFDIHFTNSHFVSGFNCSNHGR